LGLSLAKWIAAQHRTSITVVSTPGKGSKFEFRLETSSPEASMALSPKSEVQTERVV
jgi:signal transduction histidine kinase